MTRLGCYEILRPLGSGGMARVYLARVSGDAAGREVALKVLAREHAGDFAMLSHEARVIASLQHPNIAQLIDLGKTAEGTSFLVMEYVHGVSLREVLEQACALGRWLPAAFGMSVAAAAAAALHHAHERVGSSGPLGIVHRDVAPSNLMIGFDGTVKLIDFGIAWSRVRDVETLDGVVKGKVGYMAPEQVLGLRVDRRTDVFGLGVVAYEATVQARAFRATSEHESSRRVVTGDVRPPAAVRPGYPAILANAILTALAVDPDARYPTAEAMARALVRVAARLEVSLGPETIAATMRDLYPSACRPRTARGTGASAAVAALDDDDALDPSVVVDALDEQVTSPLHAP